MVGRRLYFAFPSRDCDGYTKPLDYDVWWACAHATKQNLTQVCYSVSLSAGWLPVSNLRGLSIFALSCLCFRTVLSLEKSSLLAPVFLSGVGCQEVHGSFGPLSPAV